jgi:hypothetical protein
MIKNLEIAFDFKNSKEYFLKYFPSEFTKIDKIPENLRDKKFYIFERKIEAKPLGTFLLDFLNLDFTDIVCINYFLVHYSLVNFITYNHHNIYSECEFYKNRLLTDDERNNPKLILTEEEIMEYSEEVKAIYYEFIESAQYVFRNIADKVYFKTLFENSTEQDSDFEKLKLLKGNETYESILNDISENFKDIKMNFDIDNFFSNNIPDEVKGNVKYYYSSNDFACILYITLREFLNNKKSFRLIKCQNCDYYFIPKTAHKTLYCDEIFEDGKTCKEYAESLAFSRTFANDPVCKRYRSRYKNLQKQASLSNNPEVQTLYDKYKIDGAKMLEKYQQGKITSEEFENWINKQKIKNKT